MSKTIKNNLFRFVTLRNPQLIDKKEEKPGFVFHPDEKSGKFFSVVLNKTAAERPDLLKQAAENYTSTAVKTRTEARAINEKLYLFSSWLMQHKNALSFSEIKENSNGVSELSSTQLLQVWDNLIYQTIEKKSTYVREAMIQFLVANQFLNAFNKFSDGLTDDITFTDDQDKEFTRRANASVVMSKLLFSAQNKTSSAAKRLSVTQEKSINNAVDVAFSKAKLSTYKTLLESLKAIEVGYNQTIEKAYQTELDKHNETIENLFKEATPVIVNRTDEIGNVTKIETYPDLTLPKFKFEKESGVSVNYLKDKLSQIDLNTFESAGLETYDEFSDAFEVLSGKIKKENQIISSKSPKRSKKVRIGGALLRAGGEPIDFGFDYNIPSLMEINEDGLVLPFMMLLNGLEASDVATASYTITFDNNDTASDSGFLPNPFNAVMLKLFPNGVAFPLGTQTYILSGTLTLNNGDELDFEQLVDVKKRANMGDFQTVDDNEVAETIKPVYGVTNLGIADFRRVEQEVCCYVPGEVSHIENVMAREYKERSTRNLVSSEVTTERSEERERENLSDTTTTERNEMQTEVSSVINEDESQSSGGSASVSYSPKVPGNLTLNAGAYFDSSSGSSSSNSNAQAQTYAQEITERAMERIVQKTQTKRTSRILKEFEENNKHGFDNTKGDQHVTGVYRWVDKIYKNTLINYGKRLMYEFAIPEPSKFFKEAIKKQLETSGDIESAVILPEPPIHPKNLINGIADASDLNAGNYQRIAAEYAAEVNNPPVKEMSAGKSFSYTAAEVDGNSYRERNAENSELDIPEGYYTYKAKAKWFDSYDAHINNSVVIVGEKVMPSNSEVFIDKYVGSIPVSFSQLGNLSGNANISVKLKVLPEIEEAWRNETYTAIMDAYYERLQEYNDAQNQDVIPTSDQEEIRFNPLYNRSLEKKELKRVAIELLTEQRGGEVSQNNFGPMDANGVSKVNKTETFQDHAAAVKFFEQAFDWDIMAYVFYPYFYANQNNWKELFQVQDAADPLFQAFLQSGMARTVVPVRPGFEDAVNWYMETGEIWNGQGLVVDQDDDLYVSVAEEMQTIEGVVEGTWETRLPTALTILQAESAALLESGLPCFCEEHTDDNTIMSSSELLRGDDDSAGVGVDLLS